MKLNRWWLVIFPLLYLPNAGLSGQTGFGMLEISDYLIGPYILLSFLAVRANPINRQYWQICPWIFYFMIAAFVSTVTIWWRYPVYSDYPVIFGLFKLGKLSLYGLAGIFTARALSLEEHRQKYDWVLLLGAAVIAVALLSMPEEIQNFTSSGTRAGYKSTNAVSVMMAILLVYLIGRLIRKANSNCWQRVAMWSLPFIVLGFFLSKGRGGWLAAIIGVVFLSFKMGFRRQTTLCVLIGITIISVTYTQSPNFKEQVDMTLRPNQAQLRRYNAGIFGFDDGARYTTWTNELSKYPNAPFLGTGFFHRGRSSGLWTTGSHNFWIQMLLETGLIGFGLLCVIGRKMWRQTNVDQIIRNKHAFPVQASLIAALVGGMSGEYFYGGMVLFTLLAVYAPVGSAVLTGTVRRQSHPPKKTRTNWRRIKWR